MPPGVVRVPGGVAGGVRDRGAVAPVVELLVPARPVRGGELHRQASSVADCTDPAAVGTDDREEPALLVVCEGGGTAEGIGTGQLVSARVMGEAGGVAERIGGGQDLATVTDEMAGGAAVGGGQLGHPVAGGRVGEAVGDGELDVARLATLADHPVTVVVGVVVAAVVGVDPGDHPAAVVVQEGQDGARGFGDGGEVAVRVAVADELLLGAVGVHQGQAGRTAVRRVQSQVVARRVDEGEGVPSSVRSMVMVWPLRSLIWVSQASPSPPGSTPVGAAKCRIRPLSGSVRV